MCASKLKWPAPQLADHMWGWGSTPLSVCGCPERSCQDVGFTLLFAAFCVGIFWVLGWAQANGEPERYINGYGRCTHDICIVHSA